MPATLNNASTGDIYTPGTTVTFPGPRRGFTLNVTNASIMYLLYYAPAGQNHTRDVIPDPTGEHFLTPAFASFPNAEGEGLPPGARFGGIALRNATPGLIARVTVL